MYLTDYHLHSLCSPDSDAPLEDMAAAACKAGAGEICVTDHRDLLDIDGFSSQDFCWEPLEAQFRRVKPLFDGRLTIRMGLELGEAWEDPEEAARLYAHPGLDFVIGSIHTMDSEHGGADFYPLHYASEDFCYEVLDNYFHSMERLAGMACFDVLGHVIYPLRYMNLRDGNHVTLDRYFPLMERVFKTIVKQGKGIEINTNRGREPLDGWREVLGLYRDCGGGFVTLGSDAHIPRHVGKAIPDAVALAGEYGLSVAVYEKHQPRLLP